jgi:hypothetical protein
MTEEELNYIQGKKLTCPAKPTLVYNIQDDGVWLVCSQCGFEVNLGYYGTVEDALAAQKKHDESYEERRT